jgi:hypothetical protein
MSSVKRSIAQRNNNVTQIVPTYLGKTGTGGGPFSDISGVSVYRLTMPSVQNV